jgi:cyclase
MLKKRIFAVLIIKNGLVVQSIGFKKYLPIGRPEIAVEFLNSWGIDEIVLLDTSATQNSRCPDYKMIKKVSEKCHVPLTIGGGITTIEHIEELMQCGADKISINYSALKNPKLIKECSKIFGNQCLVVSIDAIKIGKTFKVYDYINRIPLSISPAELALKSEEEGAGEILLNSVNRDGSYKGYDFTLINSVSDIISIPLIICGGAKNAKHMISAFDNTNISGAGASNFFHFTEHSVNITKSAILKTRNIRLETYADYLNNKYDDNFRLYKKEDAILEAMLFKKIDKEVI